MSTNRLCPACKRTVSQNNYSIEQHNDKSHRNCPASGYPYRITVKP